MNADDIKMKVQLGEDTQTQFKGQLNDYDNLSSEVEAMCNTDGGDIIVGVADNGTICGIQPEDVRRLNQLVSNVATNGVKNPIQLKAVNLHVDDKIVVVIRVPEGTDKPYFDKDGAIWTMFLHGGALLCSQK